MSKKTTFWTAHTARAASGKAVALGALLVSGNAMAIPHAASVASPPLVVAGMLVGLLLLGLFVGLLVRTFRNMQAVETLSSVEIVQRETDLRLEDWEVAPSIDTLRGLIELMRECESDDERLIVCNALSKVTGRYFGTDEVAWEVWVRREATQLVSDRRRRREHVPPAGEVLPVS